MDRHLLLSELSSISKGTLWGQITRVRGSIVDVEGLSQLASLGQLCLVESKGLPALRGEVIGFFENQIAILTESVPHGVRRGDRVSLLDNKEIKPSEAWLGHVINAFGLARHGAGFTPLPEGDKGYSLRGKPPHASRRRRLGKRLEAEIGVFNTFLPLCGGQRMGLFAGSGVGKSTLLARLAKHVQADVVVIGLIGERGREVNEFVEETLGEEGLKRSVVIASTSDESPLVKRRAAFLTMTVAEYFRDQGKQVLLLLDSLTRFAEAQREIGLAAGEPPAMRAFPPSTFSELMALAERSGAGEKGTKQGDITAVFTVLVQGSDMEEPVADSVRGTLDGHVVLSREIAEQGLYPAIDVLKSVSRSLPNCATDEENEILKQARRLLSEYHNIAPMVRLGAYKKGNNPLVDKAIDAHPALEQFLYNNKTMDTESSFLLLQQILHKEEGA